MDSYAESGPANEQIDPADLFNQSSLRIHVPARPSQTPTGGDSEVDTWLESLLAAPDRQLGYYDETLKFYLLLHLPAQPALTRSQAKIFLEQASHLSLFAELSYIEGTTATPPPETPIAIPNDKNKSIKKRRGGLSIDGTSSLSINVQSAQSVKPYTVISPSPSMNAYSISESSTASSTLVSIPRIPETPLPYPSTRAVDVDFGDATGVQVWAYPFVHSSEDDHDSKKKKSTGQGEMWVARVGSTDSKPGHWVGIWEFKGEISFLQNTGLISPKICLTVTATFRDDPAIKEALQQCDRQDPHLEDDQITNDDYLTESYDDVNLLSGLSSVYPVHLPASRLPVSPVVSQSTSHTRSTSIRGTSLHGFRENIIAAEGASTPLYPTIRRSYRTVFDLASPIAVNMRSVPCPVSGMNTHFNSGLDQTNLMEENDGMGVGIEVEVFSNQTPSPQMGFEVLDIEITASIPGIGSSSRISSGDVEIKPMDQHSFPIILEQGDQFNFLYSVTSPTRSLEQDPYDSIGVPIHVTENPSTRFFSRGYNPAPITASVGLERSSTIATGPLNLGSSMSVGMPTWNKTVSIKVIGRPVRLSTRALAERVLLTETGLLPRSSAEISKYTTDVFSSRWSSIVDLTPCYVASSSSHRATPFLPRDPTTTLSVEKNAAVQLPFSRASVPVTAKSTPPVKKTVQLECVAGSKRHTMSSLAFLAQKSAPLPVGATKRQMSLSLPIQSVSDSEKERGIVTGRGGRESTLLSLEGRTPGATGVTKQLPSSPRPESPQLRPAPVPDLSISASTPNASVLNFRNSSSTPNPPPTPAYPPQQPRQSFPLIESLRHGRSRAPSEMVRENKQELTLSPNAASINVPLSLPSGERDHDSGGILVSIALLPMKASITSPTNTRFPSPLKPIHPISKLSPPKMEHRSRHMKVGILDIFLVEVFVINQSNVEKRFVVGVPTIRGKEFELEKRSANLVPLENDVKIGPLAPWSCHSVRLRFLAIRPGTHRIEELSLIDTATGFETRLSKPLHVVVE